MFEGVLGALLLALAAVLFGVALIESRRPDAHRLMSSDFFTQTIVMITVGLIAFGVAFLVVFAAELPEGGLSMRELSTIGAIIAVTVAVLVGLRYRWRRILSKGAAQPAAAAGGALERTGPAAGDEGSGDTPRPASAGGARRVSRRAA